MIRPQTARCVGNVGMLTHERLVNAGRRCVLADVSVRGPSWLISCTSIAVSTLYVYGTGTVRAVVCAEQRLHAPALQCEYLCVCVSVCVCVCMHVCQQAMEVDADTAAPRRTPTNTTNPPSVKSQSTMSASVPDGLSSMAPSVPQSVDVTQTALPGVDGAVKEGGDAAGVRDKGDKQGGLLHKVGMSIIACAHTRIHSHMHIDSLSKT